MSCPNYKIIFNDETNYVAQDISEEPVVRVIPVKGEQGETGPKGEDGKNFEPTIVSELPATGDESKLYLTPKAHTTSTATGNPITISLGEDAGQIDSFQLDGDTYQQTYTGKNLIYLNPRSGSGLNGIEQRYNTATGDITITGTPTEGWSNIGALTDISLPAGTYTLSQIGASATHSVAMYVYHSDNTRTQVYIEPGESSVTVSIDKNIVSYYIYVSQMTIGEQINDTYKMQLEAGSTATSFEPYVGGVPSPNPDYPQQIQTVTGEQTVEIVGKNLFDGTWRKGQYDNGVWHSDAFDGERATTNLIPVTGGDYSISLNSDALYTSLININYFDADKTWLGNRTTLGLDAFGDTDRTKSFTLPDTAYYLAVSIRPYHRYSGQTVYANAPSQMLQVERSSTNTPYVTYSKQTLPINLGKNLFNKNNYSDQTGYYIGSNGIWRSGGASDHYFMFRVEPNTTYTFSKNAQASYNRFRVGISSGEPTVGVAFPIWGGGDTATEITLTTASDSKYAYVYYSVTANVEEAIQSLQIEVGNQKTSYAPYFTPIELCKLGTYQDYIWKDGEDWKIHKEIGKFVIDSAKVQGAYGKRYRYAKTDLPNALLPSGGTDFLCEYFTAVADNTYGIGSVYAGGTMLNFRYDENGDNIAGFRTFVTNANLSVYCQLATATDTTITDTNLIAQLEAIRNASLATGTNTITNTATGTNLAGDMEIGYFGFNPRNRYDKWLWLDINNAYEQLNNPDTASSTLNSTRSLNLTNIQSDSNENNNDEEQENEILDDIEEEER